MESELLAGRYELVAPVGKGATGQVWQGFDTVLQRAVAIKLVDLESARDPAMAERFRREGVAIAGVSHGAIVKVFDAGTDRRRGWLVMELLSGPNINTLVKQQGPLSYEIGLPLLARVADGLQAAHDAGITHRDVKPANIVLDAPTDADGTRPDLLAHPERGRPVLVDFGIARIVDEAGAQLTRPATAIGTAAYMSPEQARGQTSGPASDVYSLGCVAYHVFLGRPPFMADSSLAVAHAQAFDRPVPLAELSPDAPPALDTLITRMLAKNPDDRPTAHEVATELRAISANPRMAPTVALDAHETQAMGTAATMLMNGVATQAVPTVESVPQLVPSPTGTGEPYPADEDGGEDRRGGFRNAGRWLVALLIVGLVGALAYSWFAPEAPPSPSATVTMTMTAPRSSTAPPTTSRPPQTQSSQPPSSTEPPATSTPPPTQPTATTSVPQTTATIAPPTTRTRQPTTTTQHTTTAPPVTTATINPPETTSAS